MHCLYSDGLCRQDIAAFSVGNEVFCREKYINNIDVEHIIDIVKNKCDITGLIFFQFNNILSF